MGGAGGAGMMGSILVDRAAGDVDLGKMLDFTIGTGGHGCYEMAVIMPLSGRCGLFEAG